VEAALTLSKESRLERAARWLFLGGFVLVSVSFVVLSLAYGYDVEYRFEVAAIAVDWVVLIVAATLLAVLYRPRAEA